MRATKIAFEKRYLDDSGVQFRVRLNNSNVEFEAECGITVFPVEELDWLITALSRIREEVIPYCEYK